MTNSSTVEVIKKRNEEIKQRQKEQSEKLSNAFEAVLNSEAGIIVGRYLVSILSVNAVSDENNSAEMVANTIRRNVYISKIRPYLSEDVRNKMEN